MENPTLQIRLLGDFHLLIGNEPILSVNTSRLQSLVAYLILHRSAQLSRRYLAFTFWPDKTESQAQNNLRQLLHQLRQALPSSNRYIYSNASTMGWRIDSSFYLDVDEFEVTLDAALAAEQAGDFSGQKSNLEKSLSLYRGELLPSCYDDWIIPERESLHNKYIVGINKLIQLLESQYSYASAIPFARKLLHIDNLNEKNYQTLMRLYALNGERANALHIYHQCADTFQREIGEAPGQTTQEIYHRLLRHQTVAYPSLSTSDMTVNPPLIGRETEWQQLLSAWQRATGNGACFVLLSGDAGIGKSRLAEELLIWVDHQGYSTAHARSYAVEGRLAYGPIADLLRCDAFRPNLKNLPKVWQSEIVRLLPELLIESPDLSKPEPLKENWQRQSFYQAMMQAFLSVPQPLFLFVDDLQWCDPETLEFLHYLFRSEPGAQLLVIGTVRSEELMTNHDLQGLLYSLRSTGRLIELSLKPMDASETSRLAEHIAGHELDIHIALQLFKESEGNPLFLLEMIRSGYLEKIFATSQSSNPPPVLPTAVAGEINLPPKVHEVLLARLDSLSSSARQVASLAATIGRAFSFNVLAQASEFTEEELLRWLDELWRRRLVRVLDENTYDFSHDKLREVAYNQASLPHRRVLHRRVAQALETMHASNKDPVSAQLAFHFDKAGLPEQAIHYYYQGALVEQEINANRQAIKLLKRALILLGALPAGHDRDVCELKLLTALGVSTIDTFGHGSEEGIQIHNQAMELYQRQGQPSAPPILRGKAIDYIVRAEFKQALRYSDQLIHQAEQLNDRPLLVEANYALGVTKFWMGAFQSARDYLEKAISLYDPQDSRLHISLYGQNPKVICQSRLAFTLWCLGYASQADETSQFALNYASEVAHPWSLAYASFWNVFLLINNRASNLVNHRLADLIQLCDDFQIQRFMPECSILQGWLQAEQGEIEAGIEKIREGIKHFDEGGAEFQRPYFLSLLAELFGRLGDIEQGLTLFRKALELVEKSDERWCEAEILRRKGEFLWRQDDIPGAEEAIRKSMLVARKQKARMLELRAALALGQIWLEQEEVTRVKDLIIPFYRWFDKNDNSPDVICARQLLREM